MCIQRELVIYNVTAKKDVKCEVRHRCWSNTDASPKATAIICKIRPSKKCGYKEKLKVQSIVTEIQSCQKNWKQNVERIQDEKLPKLAFKYKPVGKRNRRRHEKRWKEKLLERC
jgi:hypothetical protein